MADILNEAEYKLKYFAKMSTAGMRLVGFTKKMIENMDKIIDEFENMDDKYIENWRNFIGEENYQNALNLYNAVKSFRDELKKQGL